MFKDEYKRQIDSISADDSVKQKVLKSIENKKTVKNRKSKLQLLLPPRLRLRFRF